MLPLCRNACSHHYLDDFRKNKPVKPPAERLSDRVRQNGKPRQTSGEEYNFAEKAAQGGASKSSAPTFRHKSRQPSDEWISQQKSASSAQQLRYPACACGIEYRQAHCALGQIEGEHSESALTAQQQADQQHA